MNFHKQFSLNVHQKIMMALCVCTSFIGQVLSQPLITFPVGSPPDIDGIMHAIEWSDAATVDIRINTNETVKVFYKATNDTLYFAFTGRLESGSVRFPEICLDTGNDKTTFWDANDWWFHVSASDCDHNGAPGVYTNCAPDQEDWLGMPNITQGLPWTDSVEMAIPLTKLNISPEDTFGIAFNVTNTFSTWKFWPDEANLDQPSTWATAAVSQTTSEDHWIMPDESGIQIYPNPNQGLFTISSPHPFSEVRLYDLQGKLMTFQASLEKVNHLTLELTLLNPSRGTYLICIDRKEWQILVIQ